MIPKIIHYCWFGNNPMPADQVKYIEEWKRLMPDYEFKCWDENAININDHPFAKEAYEAGKLAFVADYTRVWALYHEGGIYMDTDVKVNQNFDKFLSYSMFTSYEYHPKYEHLKIIHSMIDDEGKRKPDVPKDQKVPGCGLLSALVASEPNTNFMKDLLDLYDNMSYSESRKKNYTIPTTLALIAERYGLVYKNEFQVLKDNIAIFPASVFANYQNERKDSVAVHKCAGSWGKGNGFFSNLKIVLYKNRICRNIYMSIRNVFEEYPLHY